MRNIAVKADNVGDTLAAGAFNANLGSELENICTSAGFTLDPEAGPDVNLNMLAQAVAAYANAGSQYADSGIADAYVLGIATNLKSVSEYFDGMKVVFKAGNTNTGASTINVASLGVKSITQPDGTVLVAKDINVDRYISLVYNLSNDRFEIADTSLIQNYLEVSLSAVPTQDPWVGASPTITARLTKINRLVSFEIDGYSNTADTAVTIALPAFIPVGYRPSVAIEIPLKITNNSIVNMSYASVATNGDIIIFGVIAGSVFTGAGIAAVATQSTTWVT